MTGLSPRRTSTRSCSGSSSCAESDPHRMTFIHGQALSAEELERTLSRELTPRRFASLCNAIAWLTAGHTLAAARRNSPLLRVRQAQNGCGAHLDHAISEGSRDA